MRILLAIGDRLLTYAPFVVVIAALVEAAYVGGVR